MRRPGRLIRDPAHVGAAAVRKKAATSDIVLGMVGGKGTSLRELRDRAILFLSSLVHSDDPSSSPLT
jgi:hypothetical protein